MIVQKNIFITGLWLVGTLTGCGVNQMSTVLSAEPPETRQVWAEVFGHGEGQDDSLEVAKDEARNDAEDDALKQCHDLRLKGCHIKDDSSRIVSAMEVPTGHNGFRMFTQHRVTWEAYAKGYREVSVTELKTPVDPGADAERWRRVYGGGQERRSSLEEAKTAAKAEAEEEALTNCRTRYRLNNCRLIEDSSRMSDSFKIPYANNGFTTTYVYDVFWEAYAEGQR